MEPVIPMEPKTSTSIPTGEEWIGQVKWDGVRILTYWDGREVRLFNRRRRERTWHYPELTDIRSYCTAASAILDGEVIALGNDGRPSFPRVMKRDGIRRLERVKGLQRTIPIAYMIFDVLYYNGEWIRERTFRDREEILAQIIIPGGHCRRVASHRDGRALFTAIKEQDMEGIVMKQLTSPYILGAKKDYWLKVKNYRNLVAVVGGFTTAGPRVNSLLLGLYDDEERLHYVGRVGTGKLTQEGWFRLTERLQRLQTTEEPFANGPQGHSPVLWVKPWLTVEIQHLGWTEGCLLRQPSIQGLVDIPPLECRLEERNPV
ncbi:MAG: DNA ligase [bacterium]|nr:RNA ligase family protein [Bacillota bacterium]